MMSLPDPSIISAPAPGEEVPLSAIDTRFSVFTFGWALVVLFGMSSERMAETPLQMAVCVACALAMILPRSTWALGAVALAYVTHFLVDDYRHIFVHTGFVFMGNLGVLLALVPSFHPDAAAWRQRFVDAFAPVSVALATVCFFAAGVAKINTDYFTVEHSCGSIFYAHQITAFPYSLLPDASWAEASALYMALVIEIIAPVMWLHHRTRRPGFWLGGLLLFLLGTNARARYYVFTGPFLALLLLGLDWEPARRWLVQRIPPRAWTGGRIALALFVVGGVGWALWAGDHKPAMETRWLVARTVFVVWAIALFAAAALAPSVRLAGRAVPSAARLAWLVVLLYSVHEVLPYVGLRTQRNFAMASNLTISPQWSNHVLVDPAPSLPFNQLAILERSNDRALNRRGRTAWPTWVLYDHLARNPDVHATFTVNGERIRVEPGEAAGRQSLLARVLNVAPTPTKRAPRPCGHGRPGAKH